MMVLMTVRCIFIVLAQEISPVIVAVGRAHHGVYVVARGLFAFERQSRLVIELDQDHRAVDLVVVGVVLTVPADPGEPGVG